MNFIAFNGLELFTMPPSIMLPANLEPYQYFSQSACIGFDNHATIVHMERRRKTDSRSSPPDHLELLALSIQNGDASKWLTIEVNLEETSISNNSTIVVMAAIGSSVPGKVRSTLRTHQAGADVDIDLGELPLSALGSAHGQSVFKRLDGKAVAQRQAGNLLYPRVLLSLPRAPQMEYHLHMLSVYTQSRDDQKDQVK